MCGKLRYKNIQLAKKLRYEVTEGDKIPSRAMVMKKIQKGH